MFLFKIKDNNELALTLWKNNDGSSINQIMVDMSGGFLEMDRWYAVAFSWDRTKGLATIYLNNLLIAQKTTTSTNRDLKKLSQSHYRIGQLFDGYIAELAIYDTGSMSLSYLARQYEIVGTCNCFLMQYCRPRNLVHVFLVHASAIDPLLQWE
jgi:hypothetical protein